MIRRPPRSTLFPYTSSSDLAVFAETDAGRYRDLGLLDEQLCELERAHRPERLGDRRPHEHRALGLGHRPAELVEPVHEDVAAPAGGLDHVWHPPLVGLPRG